MPVFFPWRLGRAWLSKARPWLLLICLLQQQQGVMPYKKGEMFFRERPLFSVQGVCRDWQWPVVPVILSWAGLPHQASNASSRLIPAVSTEQKEENMNKKSLNFGMFVGSPQATQQQEWWAYSPARIGEMHFFCLCFYKAKHSYRFHSERWINLGCLPVLSFRCWNKKESITLVKLKEKFHQYRPTPRLQAKKQPLSIFKRLAGYFLISLFWCWHLKNLLIADWQCGSQKGLNFLLFLISINTLFPNLMSCGIFFCRILISMQEINSCTKKFVKWWVKRKLDISFFTVIPLRVFDVLNCVIKRKWEVYCTGF